MCKMKNKFDEFKRERNKSRERPNGATFFGFVQQRNEEMGSLLCLNTYKYIHCIKDNNKNQQIIRKVGPISVGSFQSNFFSY